MNDAGMTPEEEHEFYGRPENQAPQGPARRRRPRMTGPVPVRFPPEMLERVKAAADADDRSSGAKATTNSRNSRHSAVASCPSMLVTVPPPCDKVLAHSVYAALCRNHR